MAWGLGIKTCTQPMGEHSRFVWLTYNLMAESFERICTPSEKRHANRKSLVRWVASGRNPMGQTLIGVFRRGVSPKETMPPGRGAPPARGRSNGAVTWLAPAAQWPSH